MQTDKALSEDEIWAPHFVRRMEIAGFVHSRSQLFEQNPDGNNPRRWCFATIDCGNQYKNPAPIRRHHHNYMEVVFFNRSAMRFARWHEAAQIEGVDRPWIQAWGKWESEYRYREDDLYREKPKLRTGRTRMVIEEWGTSPVMRTMTLRDTDEAASDPVRITKSEIEL